MLHHVENSGYSGLSCPQFAKIEENNNMVTYFVLFWVATKSPIVSSSPFILMFYKEVDGPFYRLFFFLVWFSQMWIKYRTSTTFFP
jgi:hypothetical protein